MNWIINFCDMGKKAEDFRLPQCGCGKLARKHYEIYASTEDTSKSYAAKVVCVKCFNKFMRRIP